ncbi:hypothetical protein Dsin_008632 [Dipteronia sinensis]|uniref:Uncharacterized protein n=1 Tax=Dipteronia sinensis TaxID=43782 RepID=A0AAE0AQA8_9ROSI|nr:hypothetical protein Dsin_008632 [Dipteronia sinensis]
MVMLLKEKHHGVLITEFYFVLIYVKLVQKPLNSLEWTIHAVILSRCH